MSSSRTSAWPAITVACVATAMLMLDVSVINTALASIGRHLGSGLTGLQWLADGYTLPLAAVVMTAGSLADRFGRRRLFIVGLVLFTTASAVCGSAGTVAVLDSARVLQGIGAAILFAVSLALIAHATPDHRERARALALYGATFGGSFAMGPFVGGVLTEILGWRSVFFVNVPLGAAALWLTVNKVPESRDEEAERIDVRGQVTLGLGLAALVFGLLRGDEAGWTDASVLCGVSAGVLLLAAFVIVELHVPNAMLPLRLLKNRSFAGAQLSVFAISVSVFASFLYVTLYLQGPLGLSPVQTGLMYLPGSVAMLLVSWVTPHLGGRLGQGTLATAGLAIGTVGLALLFFDGPHTNWLPVLIEITLIFLGVGLYNPAISMVALAAAPIRQSGLAAGTLDTFRHSGTALGTAALGALVPTASALGAGSGAAYVAALHHIILLAVALAVVGAVGSAVLIGRHRAPVPAHDDVILSSPAAEEALVA